MICEICGVICEICDSIILHEQDFHAIIQIVRAGDVLPFNVGSHCNVTLPKCRNIFGPQINNVPSIIRGFKGAVTRQSHKQGYPQFQWQPRFYDRVIRSHRELEYVRQYILDNPKKWNYSTPRFHHAQQSTQHHH